MDWLSKYGGNIDCASRTILLTTPEGKRIKHVSRRAPRGSQVNSLTRVVQEEVPAVKDFPRCLSGGVTRHATRPRYRVFDRAVARHRAHIEETLPDGCKRSRGNEEAD